MTIFKSDRAIAIFAFLSGSLVTLMYRPFAQAEIGDQSIWDYIAQSILRGQLPYRDVVEIKTPLSAYLSAIAIATGRPFGIRDVIAVRLLHVLLVGAIAATTYLVAVAYTQSRVAALIASLTLLMSGHFISWMISGTEPKLPMILFGLLALLMIPKNQPFLAGGYSMLACLCWQPGLLFTGTVLLVFSNYLTRWRDTRAAKVLIGAAIPLLILVLYYYSKGALGDLWRWTIEHNVTVYAPQTRRATADAATHLLAIFLRVFTYDFVLVVLFFAGLLGFAAQRVRLKLRRGDETREADDCKDALLIPPVAYLIFCLINFQAGPDLIPLFPFIGIFAGWCLTQISSSIAERRSENITDIGKWLPKFAIVVMLLVTIIRGSASLREKDSPLTNQVNSLAVIAKELGADDKIYVHGATEILVLLNKPNANPYIFFDRERDNYIAAQKPYGFQSILDELEAQAPKIVALSRLRRVAHRAELKQWVDWRYDKIEVAGYEEVYIRKQ